MRKRLLKNFAKALFLLIAFATAVQAQSFQWAGLMGGQEFDEAHSIVADAQGNVYTVGTFRATADLDPAGGYSLSSLGYEDIFIQKLAADGSLIWVKRIGNNKKDNVRDICLAPNGDLIIIGTFRNMLDADPGTGQHNLTSNGSYDFFVERLDSDGNFIWAKNFGSSSVEDGYAVACDASGNILATGLFSGTLDFGNGHSVTSNGSRDVFIAKMDGTGNVLWAKSFGGTAVDMGIDITTAPDASIILTGTFQNTVNFNPGTNNNTRTSRGASDIFVVKLDATGDFQWVSTFEGTQNNIASAIKTDSQGNIYAAGTFIGTVDFDPDVNASNDILASGTSNGYLAKLTPMGTVDWVKTFGSVSFNAIEDISITPSDHVFVAGYFSGAYSIDPTVTLFAQALTDAFVAEFDAGSNFVTAYGFGGTASDLATAIYVTPQFDILTAGICESTSIDFDPSDNGTMTLTGKGGKDLFVQKMSKCIAADLPGLAISSMEICQGDTVSVSVVSGNLNSASTWTWSVGDCNGINIGQGATIDLVPDGTTTYYVGGTGGCITTPSCESFTITVHQPKVWQESIDICQGESYTFPDGNTVDSIQQNMNYTSVLNTVNGCDSTVYTTVIVHPEVNTEVNNTTCEGKIYTFADGTTQTITETVTYTSHLTSQSGCDSTVTETVSPVIIDASVSVDGNTITAMTTDAQYQWIDCDTGEPVQDATGISFTPTTSGNYAVIVMKDGCSSTSDCQAITVVGTKTPEWKQDIVLFPNPVTTNLTIQLGTQFNEGTVRLINLTGQEIYHKSLNGRREIQLDMRNEKPGVYFVKISREGATAVFKVVK